jgi:hypothetical protein
MKLKWAGQAALHRHGACREWVLGREQAAALDYNAHPSARVDYSLGPGAGGSSSSSSTKVGAVCDGGGVLMVVVGNAGSAVGRQQPGLAWELARTVSGVEWMRVG